MGERTYSISVNPNASLNGLDIDEQLAILSEEAEALLSHFAAEVFINKIGSSGNRVGKFEGKYAWKPHGYWLAGVSQGA